MIASTQEALELHLGVLECRLEALQQILKGNPYNSAANSEYIYIAEKIRELSKDL